MEGGVREPRRREPLCGRGRGVHGGHAVPAATHRVRGAVPGPGRAGRLPPRSLPPRSASLLRPRAARAHPRAALLPVRGLRVRRAAAPDLHAHLRLLAAGRHAALLPSVLRRLRAQPSLQAACAPTPSAPDGCLQDQAPSCRRAYAGLVGRNDPDRALGGGGALSRGCHPCMDRLPALGGPIGTAVTPNFVDNASAHVAPWCDCAASGNRREECEAFRGLFTRNRCLDGAIQGFDSGWLPTLQDRLGPRQDSEHSLLQMDPWRGTLCSPHSLSWPCGTCFDEDSRQQTTQLPVPLLPGVLLKRDQHTSQPAPVFSPCYPVSLSL
ncbi:GDNF family receptor alpha-4 isoform X7 [Choloepus didactylus]|uniref:GDNF family receptor alpha-4 isoform X7 n=1 Tax=Choloepus didactylus TaxID=27675 RepID=UPI00189E1784|nr:GDNF family receptor alpha-4 isoform X7 [Choloepus didactylus]